MITSAIFAAALWCQPVIDYQVMLATARSHKRAVPAVLTPEEKIQESWKRVYAEQSYLRHRDKIKKRNAKFREEVRQDIGRFSQPSFPSPPPLRRFYVEPGTIYQAIRRARYLDSAW